MKYAQNGRILEAGCGTGLMAGYLQAKGLEVIALDLCKKVLEYAEYVAKQSSIILPCKYEQGDN